MAKRRIVLAVLFFIFVFRCAVKAEDMHSFPEQKIDEIESFVKRQMRRGDVPGILVTVVEGEKTVYRKGFGYSNTRERMPVTERTLFELGSASKAFTGLGILSLKERGRIALNDPVAKYLPWLTMYYRGEEASVTIGQCLYHTSGIPFKTIGSIPKSDKDTALEETVRTLIGIELDHYPGERFLYASINYDVLGLIIERVTKQPFEEFMLTNVLQELGLHHTYLYRERAYRMPEMATGHRLGFLAPREYSAPTYRGNTPAGYFISDGFDIARWLKIQLGTVQVSDFWNRLIHESHVPDRSVAPDDDGASYAAGWSVYQSGGGQFSHAGSNPNFSSFLVLRPKEQIAVAVLGNLNSSYLKIVAQGLIDILQGKEQEEKGSDIFKNIDNVAFVMIFISSILGLVTLVFLTLLAIDMVKKRRQADASWRKNILGIFFSLCFIAGCGYCLYLIPHVLFWELNWEFVSVWAPGSFIPAIITVFVTLVLLTIYFQLIFSFKKKNERPFFPLVILSFISGFGNAFIIFIINEALNRKEALKSGLVLYFLLGIVIYIFGQKLIRKKMVNITNELVYSKRLELIEKLLNASFFQFERIEEGKIQAGLNNDTERLSNAPNIIIHALTSIVTLLCCFVYLGIVNSYALLLSALIILLASSLYMVVGQSARRLLERARDVQNIFFKFINDLIGGFKELSLNIFKRNDFEQDMEKSCREYRDKNTTAALKFTNVIVIGELLFTLVIGAVAFLFPIIFKDIHHNTLRTYIFVFLYMTGPVNGVLNNIPQLLQIRISWNRLQSFIREISEIASEKPEEIPPVVLEEMTTVKLMDVEYRYKNEDEAFKVGPVSHEFRPGEITFITGGNGSGKTTLAKLITGLYKPDRGTILINGRSYHHRGLGNFYSSVFSDYYLFERLYGIDYKNKIEEIEKYLKILQIDDKLKVEDGSFNTIKLSGGQRKRLALLVSYLENKSVFLFDEWAADQDPEFRKFFYHTLIQELKRMDKCVIAITHDDHYFHVADKIIKMDVGRIETVIDEPTKLERVERF